MRLNHGESCDQLLWFTRSYLPWQLCDVDNSLALQSPPNAAQDESQRWVTWLLQSRSWRHVHTYPGARHITWCLADFWSLPWPDRQFGKDVTPLSSVAVLPRCGSFEVVTMLQFYTLCFPRARHDVMHIMDLWESLQICVGHKCRPVPGIPTLFCPRYVHGPWADLRQSLAALFPGKSVAMTSPSLSRQARDHVM